MVTKAIMLAAAAHENQTRKATDIPYIMHPMESAVIVSHMKYDADLICAALLHDVAEDVKMSYGSILTMFNEKVADLVFSQSEDKSKSWQERKQHTLDELKKSTDDEVKILTLADKLSNIRSISKDYGVYGEKLWDRFNAGKSMQAWYYKGLADSLVSLEQYAAYQEFKELVFKVFT